jgi:hypothetical protein
MDLGREVLDLVADPAKSFVLTTRDGKIDESTVK